MKIVKGIFGVSFFIVLIIGIGYFAYTTERKLNYIYSYENMVKQTVREMVKQEALKDTTHTEE